MASGTLREAIGVQIEMQLAVSGPTSCSHALLVVAHSNTTLLLR